MPKDTYKLVILSRPDKFLKKLSKKDKQTFKRIWRNIEEIVINPYSFEVLQGKFKGYRKSRKGSYRIVFKINEKDKKIILFNVGKRDNIYHYLTFFRFQFLMFSINLYFFLIFKLYTLKFILFLFFIYN